MWLDVGAMVAAAAYGAHLARVRRIPLFGVLVAGIVVGVGGGMTRDVLLGLEPAAITTWYYIPAVLAAAVVGGASGSIDLGRLSHMAVQSVAIGLLIGIGVQKAVEHGVPTGSIILLGVVTGSFGGAIADILAGSRTAIMRDRPGFLSVIVLGSVVFWLFTEYVAFYAAVVMTVLVVVALRVLSVRSNWTSLYFPGDDPDSNTVDE